MFKTITPKKYISMMDDGQRVVVHQYPLKDSERNLGLIGHDSPGAERQRMAIRDNNHLEGIRSFFGLNHQIVVQTGENQKTIAMKYGTEYLKKPLVPVKPTWGEQTAMVIGLY